MIRCEKGIAIMVLGSIVSGCARGDGNKVEAPAAEVNVVTLKARDVSVPRDYICDIDGIQYVEIHARVQGYLEDIFVDEGQTVKAGQPLFRLSSGEYREMVARAEASLKRAIAEAKSKSVQLDRVKLMVDKNVMSKSELLLAKAALEAAQSTIHEARSVLENAKINLGYTFIRAPFNGVIDRLPKKRGSLINSGTLLTSVSNIDEVFAYFHVTETEYLQLQGTELNGSKFSKKLSKVSLILADGSTYPETGNIETMEGDFDRSTGTIAIRARFPNENKILKHGASGKIRILKKWKAAILVPIKATFSVQDKNYVYIIDKANRARAKVFQPVERFDNYFVVNGLASGVRVVASGVQRVKDGDSVSPKHIRPDSLGVTTL